MARLHDSSSNGHAEGEQEPTPTQLLATLVQHFRDEQAEREKRRADKLVRRAEEKARIAEEKALLAEEEARHAAWKAQQAREEAKSAFEEARLARSEATLVHHRYYTPTTPEDPLYDWADFPCAPLLLSPSLKHP